MNSKALTIAASFLCCAAALLLWWMFAQPGAPPAAVRRPFIHARPAATSVEPYRVISKEGTAAASHGNLSSSGSTTFMGPGGTITTRHTQSTERDGVTSTLITDASGKPVQVRLSIPLADAASGRFRKKPPPPVLPLAFQAANQSLLTPEQAAAADQIQEQFLADIGGEPADASSPGYLEKWRQVQPIADQRLRAAIGAQAFAAWQAEAWFKDKSQQARK